jgi:hypothetical protein
VLWSGTLKRRTLILTGLGLVLLLGFALSWLRPPAAPRHQGKSVEAWAAQLYDSQITRGTNEAVVAFQTMGAAAVPELRRLLQRREPWTDQWLLKYQRRLPLKARNYLFQKLQPGRTLAYRLGAMRALAVLGPDARAALPDLLRAMEDSDARIRWVAAQIVPQFGPEAVAALIPLTTHTNVLTRHAAVYALGEARTNAVPALPHLLRATTDADESVRQSALYSLSRLGPTAFPPTLAHSATNADPAMRAAAARALLVILPPPGRMYPVLHPPTNVTELRRLTLLSLARSRLTNEYALELHAAGRADADPAVRETAELAWALVNRDLSNHLFRTRMMSREQNVSGATNAEDYISR